MMNVISGRPGGSRLRRRLQTLRCSIRMARATFRDTAIYIRMERGSRWRAMATAGAHMEWDWAGRRLIMARGITTRFSGGHSWADIPGAGCHTTMADGCFSRAWAGCGAHQERAAGLASADGSR